MSDIRTKPSSQAYRDNYDAIFGSHTGSAELLAAYVRADREVRRDGLISTETAALIHELGGDLSKYD